MRYYANSGLFGLAIILFFLPFLEFKCNNGEPFSSMSGIQLAFGQGMTFEDPENLEYLKSNDQFGAFEEQYKRPNEAGLIAISALAIGLIVSLFLRRSAEILAIVFAALPLGTLILFKTAIQSHWNQVLEEMGPMKMMFPLQLGFGWGLWAVIIACGAIILVNIRHLVDNRRNRHLSIYQSDSEPSEPGPDLR